MPLSLFRLLLRKEMERREAPGVCEAPLTSLAIGRPCAPIRMGLRIPPRGARVPHRRVCEAHRQDAAPPGAPPADADFSASAPRKLLPHLRQTLPARLCRPARHDGAAGIKRGWREDMRGLEGGDKFGDYPFDYRGVELLALGGTNAATFLLATNSSKRSVFKASLKVGMPQFGLLAEPPLGNVRLLSLLGSR